MSQSRPDLLNLPVYKRKKLMQKPPRDAGESWHQAMLRWAVEPAGKEEPLERPSPGGEDSATREDGGESFPPTTNRGGN